MSDPATNAPGHAPDTGAVDGGDARVEQLLVAGLDHYFAARFEQAVHVWTRVLFLDRGHARARAYIERARSAMAERQRHSEELLHRGRAAFEEGEVASARRLLTAAVEQGAATDVALSYLHRLDRLAGAAVPADAWPQMPAPPDSEVRPVVRRRRPSPSAAWTVAAVAALLMLVWVGDAVREIAGRGAPAAGNAVTSDSAVEPLPVVRASDVALVRARTRFGTGHAADAIALLETIPRADPNRAEADRVLAEIQRTLLAARGPVPPDAGGAR